jgi:hypothetical protein
MGQEERFPPTRLSAGYGFIKETIAGVRHNRGQPPLDPLSTQHVLLKEAACRLRGDLFLQTKSTLRTSETSRRAGLRRTCRGDPLVAPRDDG